MGTPRTREGVDLASCLSAMMYGGRSATMLAHREVSPFANAGKSRGTP